MSGLQMFSTATALARAKATIGPVMSHVLGDGCLAPGQPLDASACLAVFDSLGLHAGTSVDQAEELVDTSSYAVALMTLLSEHLLVCADAYTVSKLIACLIAVYLSELAVNSGQLLSVLAMASTKAVSGVANSFSNNGFWSDVCNNVWASLSAFQLGDDVSLFQAFVSKYTTQ